MRYKITDCVKPLNNIKNGLGGLVLKTLNKKRREHRLANLFDKYKLGWFSDSEYNLSTLVFYGTPMTEEYLIIFDKLKKNNM